MNDDEVSRVIDVFAEEIKGLEQIRDEFKQQSGKFVTADIAASMMDIFIFDRRYIAFLFLMVTKIGGDFYKDGTPLTQEWEKFRKEFPEQAADHIIQKWQKYLQDNA